MVEWVKLGENEGVRLPCDMFLDVFHQHGYIEGSVDTGIGPLARKDGFISTDKAKQWCITEARRILTEALEKLDE